MQDQFANLEPKLLSLFAEIEKEYDYPDNTFSIKENYSKKGKNIGQLLNREIDLNEQSYPYDKNNKIAKTSTVLYIIPNSSVYTLKIRKERFPQISFPKSATITKEPPADPLYYHVAFSFNDASICQYIKDNILFCINNYESSNSFGCCSKYMECSAKKQCIHSNKLYAEGCKYRTNLENGNIFYNQPRRYTMNNKRTYKGKSLIEFPESFCIIDIETTGLSPIYDQIIELSAIRILKYDIIDQFSSLVKPVLSTDGRYVSDFIEQLTGITNDMLETAPELSSVLPAFLDFIGTDILVGHNVNFDINFLYDYSENLFSNPIKNNFVDTMQLSRILCPHLQHHRLSDVCQNYSIEYSGAHRSLADCQLTAQCYFSLHNDALHQYGTLEAFIDAQSKKIHKTYQKVRASEITSKSTEIDENNPLFGNVFVFTGTLEKMERRKAMQIVANFGGINGDSVTKKTNYLVLGNSDYQPAAANTKSNKQKKAESLKLQGQDINIIPESVFYDMIPNLTLDTEVSDIEPLKKSLTKEELIAKVSHMIDASNYSDTEKYTMKLLLSKVTTPKDSPIEEFLKSLHSESTSANKNLRKLLDLPTTKTLHYMKKIDHVFRPQTVISYQIVEWYKESNSASLNITLENNQTVRILGDYFSHMQKPNFEKDIHEQEEKMNKE